MSTHKETRLVHCYDPVAFVIAVEQGVKDGFSLDLVTPEHYPQQIGFQFICTMVKGAEKEVKNPQKTQQEAVAEQTTEGTQEPSEAVVEAPKKAETATQDVKAKPGRPAKGK
jgi:hypothetical protein